MINIFFLLALLFSVSCQKNPPCKNRQQIQINIGSDPKTLDPRRARDLGSITLIHMFFEGLTRTAKNGSLELALAEKVEIVSEGLEYRFTLRKSFWSNGDPVTSSDFARSFLSILDPQFPTDIAYQLYGIENAKKAKMGEVALSQVGISTPDKETLIIRLERPMPYFLQLVSMPTFFPVHSIVSDVNWHLNPNTYVCNGPFKLGSWKHADRIEAIKNPKYWQADDVVLTQLNLLMMDQNTEVQMFQNGTLDWAGSPLSMLPVDAITSLKKEGKLSKSPFLGTYFFRVNTAEMVQGKKNPLSSPILRKALALAIDRKAITEHVLQGGQTPAFALVPTQMGLNDTGYFQEDAALARKLLQEMDVPLEPIRISFVSSAATVIQAIQQQLETTLGIQVELDPIEPKTYFQRISNKEFQLAVGDWTADFDDPINFLEVFKYNSASTNNTNWEHPEYIELLDKSAFCMDMQERLSLLHNAEKLLIGQMPIIPVYHYALNYLIREDLKDVVLSPLGKIDFRWAHFTL